MTDFSPLAGLSEFGKLTNNSATVIYTASLGVTRIRSVTCCDNTGSTTAWTLEAYDVVNTTPYYKRKAKALTAGVEDIVNEPFYLPQGWAVRITSADATGKLDWSITYDAPSRAAAGRS